MTTVTVAGLLTLKYFSQLTCIFVAVSNCRMYGFVQRAVLDSFLPVAMQDGGGEPEFPSFVHECRARYLLGTREIQVQLRTDDIFRHDLRVRARILDSIEIISRDITGDIVTVKA